MNETSSVASSVKDNNNLSYSELMLKLKNYLLQSNSTPRFSVPLMKLFTLICGCLIIICGYIEEKLISTGISSYS
jgi:hypothetical protein